MQAFGFGKNTYSSSPFNFSSFASGLGNGFSADSVASPFNWKYFLIGTVVAAVIAILLYMVIDRADTRPIVSGFTDLKRAPAIPPEGFSAIATNLYSSYAGVVLGQEDTLFELQQLETKLAIFAADLTAADKPITTSKFTTYNTYQDIRPLADWTAQCRAKNVPERDITLQLERWYASGKKTLADLNAAAGYAPTENIDKLAAMIDKVKTVALSQCVATAHADISAIGGPRDPLPYAGSAQFEST
jgi:hypothetical protein